MKNPSQGSNLYSINFEALQSVLADANAQLVSRHKGVLAEVALLDKKGPDKGVAAYALARSVKALLRDVRAARLSDCRPFKRATDLIKEYFADLENPAKTALRSLEEHLGTLVDKEGCGSSGQQQVIAISRHGEPVIEMGGDIAKNQIPTDWSVSAVDRAELDLEELRFLFTDREIALACNRHLAKQGPHKLRGVTYRLVPRIN